MSVENSNAYRGRIAPTPSGWLHLGHACTFTVARDRARAAGGTVLYRIEDIDPARCREDYALGSVEDLHWWGIDWDGEPVMQSHRLSIFRDALDRLLKSGHVYPTSHSRKDILAASPQRSPIDGDPIFPAILREANSESTFDINYRFRVPDGRAITFIDNRTGEHSYVAGKDFGDFIVWKKDGWPSYELAVVVDDHEMGITEVVRGEDLMLSTARQLLIYEALGWPPPHWFHCPLVIDPATGNRMAKTHRSLALRELRARGLPPGREPEFYFRHL